MLINLDLCQVHYEALLIIYLQFTVKGCIETKKIESICDFIGLKNNKLHYKRNKCKKRWLTLLNGLIKKFPNKYKFCNDDINKFILLLRKGVYPYEHMDSFARFNEATLSKKKSFFS